MKKQILILIALAGMAVVSCSKNEQDNLPINIDGRINVCVSISGQTITKTLVDNNTELSGISFLHAQIASSEATTVDFSGQMPFLGARAAGKVGPITFEAGKEPLYDRSDKTSYLMAYSPAVSPANDPVAGVVTWTPDGATDILVSNLWNAGTYEAPTATGIFKLNHALAQILVYMGDLMASDFEYEAIRETWGKITAVEIKDVQPSLTFNYATNALASGGAKKNFAMHNGNRDFIAGDFVPADITAGTVQIAEVMIPPTGQSQLTLIISSQKQGTIEVPVTLPRSETVTAGNVYQIRLGCDIADKTIWAIGSTITPWDETGTGNEHITTPKPPKPTVIEFGVLPYDKITDSQNQTIVSHTNSYYSWYGSVAGGHNGNYQPTNLQEMLNNEPAYCKFEIAKSDLLRNNAGSAVTFTWTEAQGISVSGICAQNLGVGWRLPRASELRLIMANSAKLDTSGEEFVPLKTDDFFYWSATEQSQGFAWRVGVDGSSEYPTVSELSKVRCIRELPGENQPTILEYGVAPYQEVGGIATCDRITGYNHLYGTVADNTNGAYYKDNALAETGEPPYYKFEIAKKDLWNFGATGLQLTFDWATAQGTALGGPCATVFGAGWRLPRYSELSLIKSNIDALNASGNGFEPLTYGDIWSATEYDVDNALIAGEYGGNYPKTEPMIARCIREIH